MALRHGVIGSDRWQRYLKRIADKVPEQRLVEDHPQLAGTVMESLRYVPEESFTAEMFLNLLARAIDKERVSEAHPAFAYIISPVKPRRGSDSFSSKKEKLYLSSTC